MFNTNTRRFEDVCFWIGETTVIGTISEQGTVWIGTDCEGNRYVVKNHNGQTVLKNGKRINEPVSCADTLYKMIKTGEIPLPL